jgi:FtsH-binding integral membrane protein
MPMPVAVATPQRTERTAHRRTTYLTLGALITLFAVVGFWPRYFGPLVSGSLAQPLLIHVHATVFTGWLVLFFLQAYLAATRRTRLHMTVGQVGMWYGVLLMIVGFTTGVLRAAERLPAANGQAERLLFASSADMLMFAVFFGLALWYRKNPKVHRAAMVVAATSLLIAAVARMAFVPPNPHLRLLVWSTPVLVAIGLEFRTTRRVHPIYLLGLAVFVLRRYSVSIVTPTPEWASFAKWVFGFLT